MEKNLQCFRYQTVEDVEKKRDEEAVEQLLRVMKKRQALSIRNDDFATAQNLKVLIRRVEARRAAGDRLGGYPSREALTNAVYRLQSRTLRRHTENRKKTLNRIRELEANVKNLQEEVDIKMEQVNEVNGPELRVEISDLLKRIEAANIEIEELRNS